MSGYASGRGEALPWGLVLVEGIVVALLGLVLLVGAFDYLIFANIDKLSKRLNPTSLVISEVVFGILLTAVAVQLAVSGLSSLGIIGPTPSH